LNLGWNEGYSTGIYNTYIKTENYTIGNNTKVPYGCFFHSAPGSGIYINTKIIYMERDDISVSKQFPHTLVDDTNFCIHGDKSMQCGDKYTCTLILNEGYYSKYNNIGIKLSSKNRTKLRNDQFVICGGNCSTQELSTTCPLLELRMGYQANRLCQCNDKSPILNCGKYLNEGEMFGVIPSIGATSTTVYYNNDTNYHSNYTSSSSSSNSSSSSSNNNNNNNNNNSSRNRNSGSSNRSRSKTYTRFQPFTCISRKSSHYDSKNNDMGKSKSNMTAEIMFINDHLFSGNFHKCLSVYLRNINTTTTNNYNYQANINNNSNEQYYVITFDIKVQTQSTPLVIPTANTTDTTSSPETAMMINIKVFQYNRQRSKFIYFLTSPMNLYNLSSITSTSTFGNSEDNYNIDNIPHFDYQYKYKYNLDFLQSFLIINKNKYDDSKNDNTNNNIGIISVNTASQDHEVIDDNRMKIIHLIRDESMCLLTADAKIIILVIICYNHKIKNYDKEDIHNENNDIELALFLHKCRNELLKKGYVHIILLINENHNSNSNSNTNSSDYHNNQHESNDKIILQQKQKHAHHNHHKMDLSNGFHMLSLLHTEQQLSYHIDFYDV
jgi:hypothetical protein